MAIIRRGESMPQVQQPQEWDPFQAMRRMIAWDPFRERAPFPGAGMPSAVAPAFDVRETKDAFVFQADLPGFRDEDIEINVNGNRLTVSGKREAEQTEESDTYYCSERSYGSFTRSFTLPTGVDADQVEAALDHGVLSLHIPKAREAQAKRIPIRASPSGGQKTKH